MAFAERLFYYIDMHNKDKRNTGTDVARAILSGRKSIKIGQDKYKVSSPTLRTLISVSGEIGKLPPLVLKENHEVSSVIGYAEYCEPIASALAMLVCGVRPRINVWNAIVLWRTRKRMMYRYTPRELNMALLELIKLMEIKDFFSVTTSLNEINLTKPIRGVVGTTQSGH